MVETWQGILHNRYGSKHNDAYSTATISYDSDIMDDYDTRTITVTLPMNLVNIKTPQLIGIILGALTFLITIMSVLMLLYYSGSIDRLKNELSDESGKNGDKDIIDDHMAISSLHDELIIAAKTLPMKPEPALMLGLLASLVVR